MHLLRLVAGCQYSDLKMDADDKYPYIWSLTILRLQMQWRRTKVIECRLSQSYLHCIFFQISTFGDCEQADNNLKPRSHVIWPQNKGSFAYPRTSQFWPFKCRSRAHTGPELGQHCGCWCPNGARPSEGTVETTNLHINISNGSRGICQE